LMDSLQNTSTAGGFQTWIVLSISYMGCHPSHWRTHIFKMVETCWNHQPVDG
jgi:hypothetical protein